MRLDIMYTVRLELNAAELRLVCKALGGRLEKPEDIEAARLLDEAIAEKRISQAKHYVHEIEKLEENMIKAKEV